LSCACEENRDDEQPLAVNSFNELRKEPFVWRCSMEPINLQQVMLTLFTMLTLCFGIVPNLVWFNWKGIAWTAAFAALAYNFPGGAFYWMFVAVIGAWVIHFRTRANA
jgi:hypothetical protein